MRRHELPFEKIGRNDEAADKHKDGRSARLNIHEFYSLLRLAYSRAKPSAASSIPDPRSCRRFTTLYYHRAKRQREVAKA